MQPVLTVAEMRAVDEAAQRTVSLATLIGRAGRAVAGEAVSMLGGAYGRRICVVAGPGNNGNDGRVAALELERRGAVVAVVDAKAPPASIENVDLVIDAAFGTGFHGSYTPPPLEGGPPILAVDVPTGLDADLGTIAGSAVSAQRTATFGSHKPGLLLNDGPSAAGDVRLHPIGLPVAEIGASIHLVEVSDVAALVAPRGREDNKWTMAVMVVAGSAGMYGAPSFVAGGAMRAGAGMVRLGIPGADPESLPVSEAVARALPAVGYEAEVLPEMGRFRALVVGPGLGVGADLSASVCGLVSGAGVPTVVDADGLTALGTADNAAAVIAARRSAAPVVLTPHEGEFARLTGGPPGDDRIGAVRELASRTGAVVLLKGSTTVVASPGGAVLLVAAGSSRLATAGTGDVLSGVIAALLARGLGGLEAAAIGAQVHGMAACLGRPEGLVAGDLPDLVSAVLSRCLGGQGPGGQGPGGQGPGGQGRG